MGRSVDHFQQFSVFLVAAVAVHEHIDASVPYYIHARCPVCRNQFFVGSEEPLLESLSYFGLHVFGPMTEEENAGFDDGERVLVVDL